MSGWAVVWMPLSDVGLCAALDAGRLSVEPLYPNDIQPCSIDLHLSPVHVEPRTDGVNDPVRMDGQGNTFDADAYDGGRIVVNPGEFLLCSTVESVALGTDLMGRVDGKSTLGRWGVGIHVTAGIIDPGFRGTITLEVVNHSASPVVLTAGMPVAQLIIEELDQPVRRGYGGAGNHYQFQSGPQLPKRIGVDRCR